MTSTEFLFFSIEHWFSLLVWSVILVVSLYIVFVKLVPGGGYDPFHLFVAFNLGTSYAVVISLFLFDLISIRLFLIVFTYALIFFISLVVFFKKKVFSKRLDNLLLLIKPKGKENVEIFLIVFIYMTFSALTLYKSGLAAFTETNRFEQAKGIGMYVRITDLFRLFIIAYFTVKIFQGRYTNKSHFFKFYVQLFGLLLFVLFSSLQNGAKFALFESLFTAIFAIRIKKIPIKINFSKIAVIFTLSTLFAYFILSLNVSNMPESEKILYSDTNPVLERFIFRILSNGNMYYMSLPNDVIDNIQKDNLLTRFGAQIFGNTLLTNLLGYEVNDFSVGRSIMMYYDPNNVISGGPVSHIDLFAYTYLGVFGYIFTIGIAYIISLIGNTIKDISDNNYLIAILSALWIRVLAVMIEPPMGIAYGIDVIIVFSLIKILGDVLRKSVVK